MNEDIPKCFRREIWSDLGQKLTRYFKDFLHKSVLCCLNAKCHSYGTYLESRTGLNAKFGSEKVNVTFCKTIQSDSELTDYCKCGYLQTLFTMLITSLNESFSLACSIWEHWILHYKYGGGNIFWHCLWTHYSVYMWVCVALYNSWLTVEWDYCWTAGFCSLMHIYRETTHVHCTSLLEKRSVFPDALREREMAHTCKTETISLFGNTLISFFIILRHSLKGLWEEDDL